MAEVISWLSVVGINENGVEGLCPEARAAVASAALVVGAKRHLELVRPLIQNQQTMRWPSPPHDAIPDLLAMRPQAVCVLATGDPFHYGMGAVLARHIPPEEMRIFPAPSIFSQVAARMGWALQNTAKVALNGRPIERVLPHLQPAAHIIVLSADETTPAKLAALMTAHGFGEVRLQIFEHLGGEQERVSEMAAKDFHLPDVARLNCIALAIPADAAIRSRAIPLSAGRADAWFEHDGQMTKREVRAVTLAALAPRRGELLWDVGLGSGSVAIEWLLAHEANRAIGFEKNAERAARAARNAKALGVPQLVVLEGDAPAIFEGLEAPDAIFIGGGATVPNMIETCWAMLREGGRLVANAVALETEALLLAAHQNYGGELIRIGVERADPISASMSGWRPAMTVMQWSITK